MSEPTDAYTPTTAHVKEHYGIGWFADDDPIDPVQGDPHRNFDRWLAGIMAQAKAEALREARGLLAADGYFCPALDARIEKEAKSHA